LRKGAALFQNSQDHPYTATAISKILIRFNQLPHRNIQHSKKMQYL